MSLLTWVILESKKPCSWKGHHPIMCSLKVRGCAVWGSQHISINSPDAHLPSYTEVIYTGEDQSSRRLTLFSDLSFHFLTKTSEPLYDLTQKVLIQETSEQWLPAGSWGQGHPEVKGLESTTFHHWPLVVGSGIAIEPLPPFIWDITVGLKHCFSFLTSAFLQFWSIWWLIALPLTALPATTFSTLRRCLTTSNPLFWPEILFFGAYSSCWGQRCCWHWFSVLMFVVTRSPNFSFYTPDMVDDSDINKYWSSYLSMFVCSNQCRNVMEGNPFTSAVTFHC